MNSVDFLNFVFRTSSARNLSEFKVKLKKKQCFILKPATLSLLVGPHQRNSVMSSIQQPNYPLAVAGASILAISAIHQYLGETIVLNKIERSKEIRDATKDV